MSFSFPQVMGFITGALQFIVAGYALRLNRVFGTARVGWSLFWAFALLALLHLFQSVTSFNSGAPLGVEIEVMYSLISLLLLTGNSVSVVRRHGPTIGRSKNSQPQ